MAQTPTHPQLTQARNFQRFTALTGFIAGTVAGYALYMINDWLVMPVCMP